MINLNTSLVKGFDVDSFYITPPIDFLIPVVEKAKYFGMVTKNGIPFCNLVIDCEEESNNFQEEINLFELQEGTTNIYSVRPTGYLILHSSEGEDKYEVKIGNQDQFKLFDNQGLIGNELLAITLVTPGTYIAKDLRNDSIECVIVVNEPKPETVDSISNPINVNITEDNIEPREIAIVSGQPVLFDSFLGTHLKISPKDSDEKAAMYNVWKEADEKIARLDKRRLPDIA